MNTKPKASAAEGRAHKTEQIMGGRGSPSQARSFDPNVGALERYFADLQSLPLLTAEQELSLAREIEALVTEHWCALLSYRPALEVVSGAVGSFVSEPVPALAALCKRAARAQRGRSSGSTEPPVKDSRSREEATAAAGQLRELDADGSILSATDRAVREAFADDGRARQYLGRVERAGDAQRAAKTRFVAANLRLVIGMARRYDRSLLPLGDLIQEGNLGLMRAVERFDYRRGYRFSTYASWWIRHSLNRAISDKARLVRVPVHALDDLSRISRARDQATLKTGSAPSSEELAEQTGLSEEKIALLRTEGLLRQPYSLDRNLGEDREQTLHDVLAAPEQVAPEQALDLRDWREGVDGLLAELSSMEAAILRFRFGLDGGQELTLREIGYKYNLSRERIRQIQEQALSKLRTALRRNLRPGDEDGLAA